MLAIRTICSNKGLPVLGSIVSVNCFRKFAISLPGSPHPIYRTTSALQNLAICCEIIVLPVPNPPGTAKVPPFATGNNRSTIRKPVSKGSLG
ncbi:hypothetical protein ES703_47785 [subsurface metagenome]